MLIAKTEDVSKTAPRRGRVLPDIEGFPALLVVFANTFPTFGQPGGLLESRGDKTDERTAARPPPHRQGRREPL
jgi:hypothetical protein